MREYFEHAYQTVCTFLEAFMEFAVIIAGVAMVILIYLTLPVWFIPYAICKKLKERSADNA